MAAVSIPLLLGKVTGGVRQVEVAGATVAQIVDSLEAALPGIRAKILSDGKIVPTLAFTVDGKIAATGLDTPVGPQSQVNILPAFGGG